MENEGVIVAVPVFEMEVVVDADGELEVPTEKEGVVVALSEIVSGRGWGPAGARRDGGSRVLFR